MTNTCTVSFSQLFFLPLISPLWGEGLSNLVKKKYIMINFSFSQLISVLFWLFCDHGAEPTHLFIVTFLF